MKKHFRYIGSNKDWIFFFLVCKKAINPKVRQHLESGQCTEKTFAIDKKIVFHPSIFFACSCANFLTCVWFRSSKILSMIFL